MITLAGRMLRSTDTRLLWKFGSAPMWSSRVCTKAVDVIRPSDPAALATSPKPSEFASVVGTALSTSFCALVGTSLSMLFAVIAPIVLVAYITTMLSADIRYAMAKIKRISDTDELTGAYNMRSFSVAA